MKLLIETVAIPAGSTIGYGVGRPIDDWTKEVLFAGDSRMMGNLGQAITDSIDPIVVDVPEWAVLDIRELPES